MPHESLHKHLSSSNLFRSVPGELLAALEPELQARLLRAGEDLVHEGDDADAMYVLVEGALDVHVAASDGGRTSVDRLEPGAVVGEMALVAAERRSATVTAREPARVVALARAAFERLAGAHPALYDAVLQHAAPRLQRVQLGRVLQAWFDAMDPTDVHALQDRVSWMHLAAGDTLFAPGDAADGMYLVLGGRIRVTRPRDDSSEDGSTRSAEDVVADVGSGGSVGEVGLVMDAPRTERAFALRDSHVVRVPRDVAASHPKVVLQTARAIVSRDRGAERAVQRPKTFAVVPHDTNAPAARFAAALEAELRAWGRVMVLDAGKVDDLLGRREASQATRESSSDAALTHWLNEREVQHGFLVFVCDAHDTPWTRRALRQADVALVVADAGADPAVKPPERLAREHCRNLQLALVHPDTTTLPAGTDRWLALRPGTIHHHLRLEHAQEAGRMARRITGRAYGLVFSGGGARGYTHIGLIRALQERGVPVDLVAGTSMGAVVGGALALTQSYDFCYSTAASFGDPKRLLDRTLPIVALNRSRAVTALYQEMYGDARIEDLWTPFLCVSANLTRAEPVIHEDGPLWEAVRASSAIPGVFTPLVRDRDLLVDGGVMNNFPVDLMRERVGPGIVIGSNAYAQNTRPERYDLGTSVSGWKVLRQKILPIGPKKRYPSMLATLMRATSLSSKHLGEAAFALADLTIRYPTEEFGTLDFDRYDDLITIGYHVAREVLDGWSPSDAERASRAA